MHQKATQYNQGQGKNGKHKGSKGKLREGKVAEATVCHRLFVFVCLSACLPPCLPVCLCVCLSICLPACLFVSFSAYLHCCVCIYLSFVSPIHLPIHASIHPSIYLSIYSSIYLSSIHPCTGGGDSQGSFSDMVQQFMTSLLCELLRGISQALCSVFTQNTPPVRLRFLDMPWWICSLPPFVWFRLMHQPPPPPLQRCRSAAASLRVSSAAWRWPSQISRSAPWPCWAARPRPAWHTSAGLGHRKQAPGVSTAL